MLKKPLILEVLALDPDEDEDNKEYLEDNGFSDIYDSPTFPIHFWRIDYYFSDERSTFNKPLTVICIGLEHYLVKCSKIELSQKIKDCMS
jgi:hypothetical protein